MSQENRNSQDGVDNVTALNAAFPPPARIERRQAPRLKYHVVATLEPVSTSGPDDVRVVTRDASTGGAAFLSTGALPEGSRAVLHLPAAGGDPDGEAQRIECRVRRSRELGNGLFEGSVEFIGEQPQFSDTRIRPTAAPRPQ
jgi:c-di-GMP-binding flagellar brake protein YcgR